MLKPEKTSRYKHVDLTFWKLFCCLAVSAMCLQEDTHCFSCGEAFARLALSCSAVPPSSPSSVLKTDQEVMTGWTQTFMYTFTMETDSHTYSASRILISWVHFFLWVWQTWVQTELFSLHIPLPGWWRSWSFCADRGPGTRRPCLEPEFLHV